ncbi:hypothetical protein [Phenylobacterium aquaticum]|uniref:hypothetical protein n=1 Tax=Phenylobacterium aquaticum TaxID=1763816 RepID=UPI0026EC1DBE|nr:hypothetical protein [Phenylobacterium aquaticum]
MAMVAVSRRVRSGGGQLSRLLLVMALLALAAAAGGYFAWSGARDAPAQGPSGISVRLPLPPAPPRGPQAPGPVLRMAN